MSSATILDLGAITARLDTEDAQAHTIARLRAAGEQLATMLRATGACTRCKGEGEVDCHSRGVHLGEVRAPCPRCNGERYVVGAMAALQGWEEAIDAHASGADLVNSERLTR